MLEKIKTHKSTTLILLLVVAVLTVITIDLFRSGGSSSEASIFSEISPEFIMGTVVEVSMHGAEEKLVAQKIFDAIRAEEKELLSWREKSSVVSRLNSSKEAVLLNEHEREIFSDIINLCEETEGRMDLTVGKLTKLWDFDSGQNLVPSKEEIEKALETVGYENLKISANTATLEGQASIDLGAFGKGIACDLAKDILENSQIHGATVSVGGSVLVFGKPENKAVWTIGIRNPDGGSMDIFALIEIDEDCVISTSGMYERGFSQNGDYYHHILDAKTGYPAESELKSVTLISKSGLVSDALSTACFILGYEQSIPLLEKFNSQAVFVKKDNTVLATDGIKDKITIKNEGFKIES